MPSLKILSIFSEEMSAHSPVPLITVIQIYLKIWLLEKEISTMILFALTGVKHRLSTGCIFCPCTYWVVELFTFWFIEIVIKKKITLGKHLLLVVFLLLLFRMLFPTELNPVTSITFKYSSFCFQLRRQSHYTKKKLFFLPVLLKFNLVQDLFLEFLYLFYSVLFFLLMF